MNRARYADGIITFCLLTSACASTPPPADAADGRHFPVTVSFGNDSNTLLLGTCPKNASDSRDCRVEMLDIANNRSVAFTAPAGRYLHMPSLAADGKHILAVATAIDADETGNRAAAIVRFDPQAPDRATVVVSSPTELQMPSETESGFAYWTKLCDGPKDRYCKHEPMVQWPGEMAPHGLGRNYGYRTIGKIFTAGKHLLANAEFPEELDLDHYDILSLEDTNGFWLLDPAIARGYKKVAQAGVSGVDGARDARERLHLHGQDRDGLGFFTQSGSAFRRVKGYSDDLDGGIQDFTVDPSGTKEAVVLVFNRQSDSVTTKVLVSDKGDHWRGISLPVPLNSAQLGIEQKD